MNSERAFLKAITESPDDQHLRYVFADWLEEKGDQRAELIRIEEQSKLLALWSDEYCALKPRRDKLRQGGRVSSEANGPEAKTISLTASPQQTPA